jgi:molybdopterin molybdotransferase
MQEKVKLKDNQLFIEDAELQKGNSLRPAGSEIKKGALALSAGTLLSPAAIGFLSGIGISTVKVIPDPTIIIIVTGNELQQPGEPLQYGQVYESNSIMLGDALKRVHMTGSKVLHAEDKLHVLTAILKTALEQADLVLLTGGISAGDYDFVLPAADACGVNTLFHKIKQRPGKPLFFGKKGNKIVFGLPGNPSSVLTCFYEYVLPALSHLTGRSLALKTTKATLAKPYKKSVALTVFLKAWYDGESVTVLDAQESYRLSSFAKANCLLVMEENAGECAAGTIKEIHLLPE